jgi:hypothetical protein
MTAIALGASMLMLSGCSGRLVNQGEKVGSVIKVAQQGMWVKTWEIEVVRGGMSNGSGAFSTTPLHATINDPDLLKKAQKAFDEQYEVKVTYNDYYCWTSMQSESSCVFVSSIDPLRK